MLNYAIEVNLRTQNSMRFKIIFDHYSGDLSSKTKQIGGKWY